MKKLFIIIAVLLLASCKKEVIDVSCIKCIEWNSMQKLDYCGTPEGIRLYKENLYKAGASVGQNWDCN